MAEQTDQKRNEQKQLADSISALASCKGLNPNDRNFPISPMSLYLSVVSVVKSSLKQRGPVPQFHDSDSGFITKRFLEGLIALLRKQRHFEAFFAVCKFTNVFLEKDWISDAPLAFEQSVSAGLLVATLAALFTKPDDLISTFIKLDGVQLFYTISQSPTASNFSKAIIFECIKNLTIQTTSTQLLQTFAEARYIPLLLTCASEAAPLLASKAVNALSSLVKSLSDRIVLKVVTEADVTAMIKSLNLAHLSDDDKSSVCEVIQRCLLVNATFVTDFPLLNFTRLVSFLIRRVGYHQEFGWEGRDLSYFLVCCIDTALGEKGQVFALQYKTLAPALWKLLGMSPDCFFGNRIAITLHRLGSAGENIYKVLDTDQVREAVENSSKYIVHLLKPPVDACIQHHPMGWIALFLTVKAAVDGGKFPATAAERDQLFRIISVLVHHEDSPVMLGGRIQNLYTTVRMFIYSTMAQQFGGESNPELQKLRWFLRFWRLRNSQGTTLLEIMCDELTLNAQGVTTTRSGQETNLSIRAYNQILLGMAGQLEAVSSELDESERADYEWAVKLHEEAKEKTRRVGMASDSFLGLESYSGGISRGFGSATSEAASSLERFDQLLYDDSDWESKSGTGLGSTSATIGRYEQLLTADSDWDVETLLQREEEEDSYAALQSLIEKEQHGRN